MSDAATDCEQLLNFALPMAESMLELQGGFFPFASVILADGSLAEIEGLEGPDRPPPENLIGTIKAGLIEGARKQLYRATALISDVSVIGPQEAAAGAAISIELNHRDDYSVTVLFPYRIEGSALLIAEPTAETGEDDIFPRG
jgi:hypothetical protein